jgi:hypothetical protein
MRFNPTISVYWLWLVVIGGFLSVVPTECISISHVYVDGVLIGYNDPHPTMDTAKWILLHAAISVLLAVVATTTHHALAKRFLPNYKPDSKTFSLASLLLTVAGVVCAFSFLASLGAIPAVYLVVLIFVAGRGVTLLLAAVRL